MRRKPTILALCFAAVVLVLTAWLLWRPSAVTKENIHRIQPGMTRAEVEAILGGPPQEEPGGGLMYLDGDSVSAGPLRGSANWIGDDWAVTVQFRDGCVEYSRLASGRGEESWLHRFRRRLPI
jgi:hypothetical protein